MNNKINMKLLLIGLGVILISIVLIVFCIILLNKTKVVSTDSKKFKEEYESLNGDTNTSGKEYKELEINSTNPIKYSSYEEIFDILDNGTGVIYFGFPECPWCRTLVPVLLDAANEVGIETIFYLNNKVDRNVLSLGEDGKIVTETKGTDNYFKLLDKLSSVLGEYEGLNDSSIKRLYFPTVLFVVEGKIVDINIATVDSQTDPYISLTTEQYNELKDKLIKGMEQIISCTDAC